MWKTNVKLALRYMRAHKGYTALNITALTLGFFCFIVLSAWVGGELNFDQQYENVYRLLQTDQREDGSQREMAVVGHALGAAAEAQFPEIEEATLVTPWLTMTVGNDPMARQYERATVIDSSFFDVFPMEFVAGNPSTFFAQENGILLTKSLAKKYFGDADPMQQEFWTNWFVGTIAGVIKDIPDNTHLEGDLFLSHRTTAQHFPFWQRLVANNWQRGILTHYYKLRPDANPNALAEKMATLVAQNWGEEEPFDRTFQLQPVQDIHLYANEAEGEINADKGSAFQVRLFGLIALAILLVACFNYAGLVNVSFIQRGKDIGLHKTIGATRAQMLRQFFTESLLMTLISLVLAVIFVQIGRGVISELMNRTFDWAMVSPTQIAIIAGAAIGVVLLSTAYPAWIATSTTPMMAIRNAQPKREGWSIRRVATVAQFTLAIALLACAVIFYQQIQYLQNKSLGFASDGVIVADINSGVQRSQFRAIKQTFGQLAEVQSVSVASRVPGECKNFIQTNVQLQGSDQDREMIFIGADNDFLNTFDIELTSGLNFTGDPSDATSVLINETAVAALGLDDPVGQMIEIPSVNNSGQVSELDEPFRARIAGVVADFHFEDFRQSIKPLVIASWNNPIQSIDYYAIRVNTDNLSRTVAALQETNRQFDAENPLLINFLDDQLQRFYEADIRRSQLLMFFAGVVILISALGLFSITAFAIRQRTKEIGIRKVLGASVQQIVALISKDFLVLVLIAILVAVPIAWWGMNAWLSDFAYRIELQWWMFALSGAAALLVALLTVSWQAIRAAVANPVDSLRSE